MGRLCYLTIYYLSIIILSNYFLYSCIEYQFFVLPIWFIFELCILLRWNLFLFKISWSTLFIGNAVLFYKARSIKLHFSLICIYYQICFVGFYCLLLLRELVQYLTFPKDILFYLGNGSSRYCFGDGYYLL